MAARLQELGHKIGGFSAYVTSGVPAGSGLSSSAALEILLGSIFSFLYNDGSPDPVMLAQVGQYAENRYFGKPCGLMDQLAASVGGAVAVDFLDLQNPKVESIPCDLTGWLRPVCGERRGQPCRAYQRICRHPPGDGVCSRLLWQKGAAGGG